MPHLLGWQRQGVEFYQSRARIQNQLNELVTPLRLGAVVRRQPAMGAPLPSAFLFNERGERLVELGVVLHIKALMRQFMEDQRCQPFIAPTHHRTDNRIVEPAERRIGLDAADRHVHTLQSQQRRLTTGRALVVIAAVSDATGDGKAVVLRCKGEFRRGEHVPDYERSANVGVQTVALVIRQMQLLAGKRPGLLRLGQMRTQLLIAGGVGNHVGNWLSSPQQLQLATGQLAVIADAGATVEQQKQHTRKQNTQNAIK